MPKMKIEWKNVPNPVIMFSVGNLSYLTHLFATVDAEGFAGAMQELLALLGVDAEVVKFPTLQEERLASQETERETR